MAWDDSKSDAADPDNPTADEQVTASEWNDHVTEGHFPADELNLGVDGGDPVFTDPQNGDQVVMRYDRSEGTWVIDALEAENAKHGTVSGFGEKYHLVDRKTPSSDTGTIQFSNLSGSKSYKVFYQTSYSNSGDDIIMRINGDGASTGQYGYWDASGTKQSGENEWLVVSPSGTSAVVVSGVIYMNDIEGSNRVGYSHHIRPQRYDEVGNFSREGGYDDDPGGLSSIDLIANDDWDGGSTLVELWERDYA